MIFINPKIYFTFKKIFGSEDSKDILISFLNSLIYQAQPVIQDLEILDPYIAPKIRGIKQPYLDIKAKIIDRETGEERTVIIEMQILNIQSFDKRILYNAAKSYSIQLTTGQSYDLQNSIIALTITDFVMFPDLPNVTSHFVLKEKEYLIDYPIYDIELIFVELPKFKKDLEELETIIDKWLFFLNNARTLQDIPSSMDNIPELKKAFCIANQANLTVQELDDQEKSEFFIQDFQNVVSKAVTRAVKEATKKGLEQGRKEALAQAIRQKTEEIARKMLGVLDDQAIAEMTGLTLEELQSLRS